MKTKLMKNFGYYFVGLIVLILLILPSAILAEVPRTSISMDPERPDGYFGWYRTMPTLTLTSNQQGNTYYQWDTTEGSWTTYSGPFQALVGNYTQNDYHTLYAYSENAGDTEKIRFFRFKVDPNLPVRSVGGSCQDCHGPNSYKDQVSFLLNTAHDMATDPEKAPNRCQRCHKEAMSGTAPFLREDGIYDPWQGILHQITGNDNSVCYSCHENGFLNSAYSGKPNFDTTKHSSEHFSDKALVRWPDKNFAYGMCGNCHDPHGVKDPANPAKGIPDYRNASSNNLCFTCHDDSKATAKPLGYSYQGQSLFNAAEHGSSINEYTKWPNSADTGQTIPTSGGGEGSKAGECTNCHNPHGKDDGLGGTTPKLTLDVEEMLCYGGGIGGCHSTETGSQNGINIFNRFNESLSGGTVYLNRHNVNSTEQADSAPGAPGNQPSKVECTNCHNSHINNRNNKIADPDAIGNYFNETKDDSKLWNNLQVPNTPKGISVLQPAKTRNVNGSLYPIQTDSNGKDAFIASNTPSTNYGAGMGLSVGYRDSIGYSYKKMRTLIEFTDLSKIPQDATVDKALISWPWLDAADLNQSTYKTINIKFYRVTEPWLEDTVTWNNQPAYDSSTIYASGSAILDKSAMAAPPSGTIMLARIKWEGNLKNLVQGWIRGDFPNYGLIMISDTENGTTNSFFKLAKSSTYDTIWPGSSEYQHNASGNSEGSLTNKVNRPTVKIEYSSTSKPSVKDSIGFCLKCHDGLTPQNVIVPNLEDVGYAGVRQDILNVAQNYLRTDGKGDMHGAGVGRLYQSTAPGDTYYTDSQEGEIIGPYYAGMDPILCEDCHDPHGSKNKYHLKENINWQANITTPPRQPLNASTSLATVCGSCHRWWHDVSQECNYCHFHGAKADTSPDTGGLKAKQTNF